MQVIERSGKFLSLSATRTRTLRSNFLWNAVGSGVFALSQWGVLICFAKLGSTILVGQVVYGLAITAPLFVVAGLQLRSIQATDANNRHSVDQYLGLRTVMVSIAAVVAALIAAVMWAVGNQSALIILIWALVKTVDSGSDALYGFFQQSERMDYVGLSLTLRGFLAVACVAVLFRASHSAPLALAGLAVGWFAVFILFDVSRARNLYCQHEQFVSASGMIAKTLRPTFAWRQLTRLCVEAAPLGVVALFVTFQVQIPRYIVAGLLHNRALGLFAAAAYLTFTGGVLVNSLGAPACVRLAKYYVTEDRFSFRRLMTKLLLIAVSLGIIGILVAGFAGARILTLLYTAEYSGMAGVLTMLCAAGALAYVGSFLGYGMTAMGRFRIQVPIFVAGALITLTSCYFLTERDGLMGTASGILIGNLGQLLMSAAVVWRTVRRQRQHTVSSPCPIGQSERSAS